MEICIVGWYYFPQLMGILPSVHETYPVTLVCHRTNPVLTKIDVPYFYRENRGCEYGAYDWYIKRLWKGDPVLFMHDDVIIRPRMVNYEIESPAGQFSRIAEIDQDLSYIFKSAIEEQMNAGVHGRGIYMSPEFIQWLLDEHDGIWWDRNNDGHIIGPTPDHCEHFNRADYVFKEIWMDARDKWRIAPTILPAFEHANRGRFDRIWNPVGQGL